MAEYSSDEEEEIKQIAKITAHNAAVNFSTTFLFLCGWLGFRGFVIEVFGRGP